MTVKELLKILQKVVDQEKVVYNNDDEEIMNIHEFVWGVVIE